MPMNKTQNRKSVVFKVVSRNGANNLISAFVGWWEKNYEDNIATKRLTREYAIDKVTRPLAGTKLFAFRKLSQAIAYAKENPVTREVYEAEAINARKNGWLSGYEDYKTVRKFFKFKSKFEKPDQEFDSCVCCDSIKLLKRIR
jgi:hypothetical protein